MSRVVFFMLVSANGFYERGPWQIDWHNVDAEFNDFAIAQLDSAAALLFGRKTYEGMADYWPTEAAIASDPEVAGRMNAMSKVVFSRTLESAAWSNTRLVRGEAADEVAKLRERPGKDLILMASSDLASGLAERGLIDEYRILVNPVALPTGKPVLSGVHADVPLALRSIRTFASGNVLMVYGPGGRPIA